MEKIWLKNYPEGVPEAVDLEEFSSLRDIIEKSCRRFEHLPAFSSMGTVLNYGEIDRLSTQFGAYLQHKLGLKKGARVAVMMPNLLQYPVAAYGILRAGLTVVNVNPLYTPRELQHQLADSGADTIVILENFAHTLEKVLERTPVKHVITTRIGDLFPFPRSLITNLVVKYVKKMVPSFRLDGAIPFPRVLAEGRGLGLDRPPLDHNDVAFLQYTGGTTGLAKGAVLTHGNMVANLQQASAWIHPVTREGEEIIITALPLYHIFSLTANCLTFMKIGAQNVLITNPRDIPGFIKELGKVPFTAITGVNTLFNALLNAQGFDQLDFSHLKLTLGGGMAVQRAVAERWQKTTGVALLEAYGLTETSPAVCINPLNSKAYNGSIGLPVSSTEVSLRDDAGREVPVGEVGELCVRGPQVMQGYWNRPDETRAAMTDDGYFCTGDMATVDEEGFVRIVDRKKDMILVSGFNVYPNEVEDVVASHPDILECAAIGVADEHSGEVVKVVAVRKNPSLSEADLVKFCRERLSAYKVPKQVEFREELPKTNVGKILRRELKPKDSDPTTTA